MVVGTEYALWTIFLGFMRHKTFLWLIITEFERKVDVQNRVFGWVRFQNHFLKIIINDNKKFEKIFTVK